MNKNEAIKFLAVGTSSSVARRKTNIAFPSAQQFNVSQDMQQGIEPAPRLHVMHILAKMTTDHSPGYKGNRQDIASGHIRGKYAIKGKFVGEIFG